MREVLDHPLISGRYFFPQAGALEQSFWVEAGDARLACSYHELDPAARTLVHFHGNGEIVDDYLGPFVEQVMSCGCNLLLAEYRGYGRSGGRPALGQMLLDVVPTLNSLGKPAEELIVFGRSVGSLFALEAVAKFPHVAALVLESGVADVLERLLLRVSPAELGMSDGQFADIVAQYLDHKAKLAAYSGPVLVMHTRQDGLVDLSHGERLYEWAKGEKKLRIFERGNHNTILAANWQDYFSTLAGFLRALD